MANSVAVLFQTSEGQTRKVAETVASHLRSQGLSVEVMEVGRETRDLVVGAYQGVVVGASVHAGSYPRKIRKWLSAHHESLNGVASAFFSVSMSEADEEERETLKGLLEGLLEETRWTPEIVASFAGALPFSKYGFIKKRLMNRIMSEKGLELEEGRDYEYTDWDSVREFAERYAALIEERSAGKSSPLGSVPLG